MQAILYNARGHDRQLDAAALAKARLSPQSLLWVNASAAELANLALPRAIAGPFAACTPEVGAVRVHPECYSLTIPVLGREHDAAWDTLSLVAGADWLISYGSDAATDFADLVGSDVGETMKGSLSGSTMAAALIGEHFSRIHARIADINHAIDRLEEATLTGQARGKPLGVLAVLRRRVSRLRTLVSGYRPVIHALTRPDLLPDIDADDEKHFAHLRASYDRLEDGVARLRETVVASFELYATRVAQDTNRLLRTLTFVTIGIGLIGALAGIFGMNFETAFFKTGDHGFYVATGVMLVILAGTVAVAAQTFRQP